MAADHASDPTFDRLFAEWTWQPIPDCHGRFRLASGDTETPPEGLVGPNVRITEHRSNAARDAVIVAPLTDGGLIGYRRDDGTYVHTLNTPDGLRRKLLDLGIVLAEA